MVARRNITSRLKWSYLNPPLVHHISAQDWNSGPIPTTTSPSLSHSLSWSFSVRTLHTLLLREDYLSLSLVRYKHSLSLSLGSHLQQCSHSLSLPPSLPPSLPHSLHLYFTCEWVFPFLAHTEGNTYHHKLLLKALYVLAAFYAQRPKVG